MLDSPCKTLSCALRFSPLDRLQINSRATLRDATIGESDRAVPWWYFQRTMGANLIEVRTPSGTPASIDVADVCNFAPGQSVHVRAMPVGRFTQWLSLSPNARDSLRADPTEYEKFFAPARVIYVSADRWQNLEAAVVFDDPSLRATTYAPIHSGDHAFLKQSARRSVMPVMRFRRGGNLSATDPYQRAERTAARDVRAFILAAVYARATGSAAQSVV